MNFHRHAGESTNRTFLLTSNEIIWSYVSMEAYFAQEIKNGEKLRHDKNKITDGKSKL